MIPAQTPLKIKASGDPKKIARFEKELEKSFIIAWKSELLENDRGEGEAYHRFFFIVGGKLDE